MGKADLDHCTCSRCFEAPWGIGGCALAPFEFGMENEVSRSVSVVWIGSEDTEIELGDWGGREYKENCHRAILCASTARLICGIDPSWFFVTLRPPPLQPPLTVVSLSKLNHYRELGDSGVCYPHAILNLESPAEVVVAHNSQQITNKQ